MSESASGPVGWNPKRGPFSDTVLAINFVADAGRLMLESSTSVSEVEDRLHRFLPVVGLDGCALEGTLNSLTLSYWQPGQAMPITTMRNVRVATPRLERLAGADRLLDQVESGTLELDEAVSRLRDLEDAPYRSQRNTHAAILLSVIGWLIFVDGLDLVTVVVALLATILTFPIGALVRRLHFPALGATFLVAIVVAAIPNLLAAAGVSLLVGPAVVGALFIHLPGRAFVSSVIDGLANSPLSSISRGIEAVATAGFLALGMLVGNKIGTGLGLSYTPDVTATPIPQSLIGSGLGVLGLAVAWAMPRRQIAPAVAISAMGWLIVALFTAGLASQADWLGYALAAGVVGLAGAVAASLQHSTASVYTGVAILPLVPGFTLYTGMLAIAQGDTSTAASQLGDAGIISLAIAVGVAIGLGVGTETAAFGQRIVKRTDRTDTT